MVRGDGLVDRLAEVMPQMPPISYLDRLWCTSSGALSVSAGSVPTDDLYPWMPTKPVRQRFRVTSGSTSTGRRVGIFTMTVA